MKTFVVVIPEVHYNHMQVEADNAHDAYKKVMDGEGDSIELEFSHTDEKKGYVVMDDQTGEETYFLHGKQVKDL